MIENLKYFQKIEEESSFYSKFNGYLEKEEIVFLELSTNKQMNEILFDSNIHSWSTNNSEFGDKIMNKNDVVIIVEDNDGNKFGEYLHEKVTSSGGLTDSNAFLFSLKSNGRIKEGMLKFEITSPSCAFYLWNDNGLFSFGNTDTEIKKQGTNQSYYNGQSYFNYHGYNYALRGNGNKFTPKRITAYQLK